MSDTIEPMPTSGVRGQTGDRENLQVPAAELVERAKTEGSGNRVLRGGFTSLIAALVSRVMARAAGVALKIPRRPPEA